MSEVLEFLKNIDPANDPLAPLNQPEGARAARTIVGQPEPQPKAAATALRIAAERGISAEVLRPIVDEVDQQQKVEKSISQVDASEALRRYIEGSPLHAEVSSDDFEKLGFFEKLAQAPALGWQAAFEERQRSRSAIGYELGVTSRATLKKEREEADRANRKVEGLSGAWWLGATISNMLGSFAAEVPEGGTAGLVGAALGTLAGGPVGAMAGTALGVAISGAITAAGSTFDDLSQREEQLAKAGTPQPIPYAAKVAAATTVGVASAIADRLTLSPIVGNSAKTAIKEMADEALQRTLKDRVAQSAVRYGRPLTEAAVIGGASQATLQVVTDIASDLAATSAGEMHQTFLNSPERREQIVSNLNQALVTGIAVGSSLALPGLGVDVALDRQRAVLSRESRKAHDQLLAARDETETFKRSPEAFEAFAGPALRDKTIEIDADLILESGGMDELISLVPGLDKALARAIDSGGSVTVPYAKYLTKVTPELDKALAPGIRFDPDGLTEREAEFIDAWHGSPHKFARFDYSKIGTGEGNQAYAYGLYLAKRRGISEYYQESLVQDTKVLTSPDGTREVITDAHPLATVFRSDRNPKNLDEALVEANRIQEGDKKALEDLIKQEERYILEATQEKEALSEGSHKDHYVKAIDHEIAQGYKKIENYREHIKESHDLFEAVKQKLTSLKEAGAEFTVEKNKGHLYRVKVKAKPEELLDWDKPVKSQPQLKAQLDKALSIAAERYNLSDYRQEELRRRALGDEADMTGEQFYKSLGYEISEMSASEVMKDAGIKGVQYLDASSRGLNPANLQIELDFANERIETLTEHISNLEKEMNAVLSEKVKQSYREDIARYGEELEKRRADKEQFEKELAEQNDQTHNIVTFSDDILEILEINDEPIVRPSENAQFAPGGKGTVSTPESVAAAPRAPLPDLGTLLRKRALAAQRADAASKAGDENALAIADQEFKEIMLDLAEVDFDVFKHYAKIPNNAQAFPDLAQLADTGPEGLSAFGRGKQEPTVSKPARAATKAFGEALDTERADLWLTPLFTEPAAVGMDTARFKRYSRLIEKATELFNTKALAAATREAKRRLTKEWKEKLDSSRVEATEALNERPEVQAYEFFTKNKLFGVEVPKDARIKLDRAAAEKLAGEPLPKVMTQAKGGMHPDEMAPYFGLNTGVELVKALQGLQAQMEGITYAKWRREAIEADAVRRTEEALGALDEKIEREAREAALHRTQQDILNEEIAALGEEIGAPPFQPDDLRLVVGEQFRDTSIHEAAKYHKYARAAGTAGRGAEMALLKASRDVVKAFDYKQKQFKNHLWAMEAQKFRREVERFERRAKKLGKKERRESIAQPFLDQIHSLLLRHGLPVNRDIRRLDRALEGKSLEGFIQKLSDDGLDLEVDRRLFGDSVRDIAEKGDGAMTVDEFRGLVTTIKSLEEAGRAAQEVVLGGKREAFNEVRRRLVEQLETLPLHYKEGRKKIVEKALAYVHMGDAFLLQTKQLFEWLDGDKPGGPFGEIYRNIVEAAGYRKDLTARVNERTAAIAKLLPPDANEKVSQSIFTDERLRRGDDEAPPMAMTRMDLIGVALNLGNSGNQERLIHGFWPETKADVKAYIAKRQEVTEAVGALLRKEDLDYIESVWDFFEWLRPEIEAAELRRTGVYPKMVEAHPLELGGRKVKGGYYPIFYDPVVGARAPDEDAIFQQRNYEVNTNRDYLKERAEASTVVEVDGKLLGRQLNISNTGSMLGFRVRQIVNDLAMRDSVEAAWKLLNDPLVRQEINKSIGPEYFEKFRPYLQSIANRFVADEGMSNRWAEINSGFRGRVTVALLGLSSSVMLTPSMGDVARNIVRLSKGMGSSPYETLRLILGDKRAWKHADENSPELRHWGKEGYSQELDEFGMVPRKGERITRKMADIAFAVPITMEKYLAHIHWILNYKEGLQKGLSEEDAVWGAEKSLKDSFPRANREDLAPILTAHEAVRTLFPFYSYMSWTYNRTRKAGRKARQGQVAGALMDFISFMAIPAYIGAHFFDFGVEEDDEDAEAALKYVGGSLATLTPITRDLFAYQVQGFKGVQNPIARTINAVWDSAEAGAELAGGEDFEGKHMQTIASGIGLALGIPIVAPSKAARFVYDYQEGAQDGETFDQWRRGLTTGKSEVR